MFRNLVLCADGTCNAFGHSSSNVARLVEQLDLDDEQVQLAVYDQGIGTRVGEHTRIEAFRQGLRNQDALHLLDPPADTWSRPWTWPFLLGSMAFGWGLKANVRQLYVKLSELYLPGDKIFLFGFSRGAFTVRALAGLTWRYGIPAANDAARAEALFPEAWDLFLHEFPDDAGMSSCRARQFRETHDQRACPIHFLGLWDTVKSYGGVRPIMLPHLRHNPSVTFVRHALAIDERRAWFDATTWGWLDSDRTRAAAMARLEQADLDAIARQDVEEVWFSGCHADVGGGGRNGHTSAIALRWMLGEAAGAGLRLNSMGRCVLAFPREREIPQVEPSRTAFWRTIEQVPRWQIDNSGVWPRTYRAKLGAVPRDPLAHPRGKTVSFHESVADLSRFKPPDGITLKRVPTSRTDAE